MLVVGIGGGGERDKNISEREFVGKSACSADTDQVLYAVFGNQLPGVDPHGRHTHAGALYGDRHALIGPGEAVHIADVGVFFGTAQEILCDKFCS